MSKRFRVFWSNETPLGTVVDYATFGDYSLALAFVEQGEKEGLKFTVVEQTLQGKNRGQEWTVYRSATLTPEY